MNSKLLLFAITGGLISSVALAQSGPPTLNATVVNSASNPVPVSDRKTPFLRSEPCSQTGLTNTCRASFTVASTERLVIEFFGAECENGFSALIQDYPTPMLATIDISGVKFGLNLPATGVVFNSARRYTFGQTVSINAPAGSTFTYQLNVSAATSVQCVIGLSGYRVPAS